MADDPAVVGFRSFLLVSARALQNEAENPADSLAVVTGPGEEMFRSQIEQYRQNGWRLVGSPRWEIVGIQVVDDMHRRVLTCEYDAATYPVDRDGIVVREAEEVWLPGQAWMVLLDGAWKFEGGYSATHECEGMQ